MAVVNGDDFLVYTTASRYSTQWEPFFEAWQAPHSTTDSCSVCWPDRYRQRLSSRVVAEERTGTNETSDTPRSQHRQLLVRGTCLRLGCGTVRHLETLYLWVQAKVQNGTMRTVKIHTEVYGTHKQTKSLDGQRFVQPVDMLPLWPLCWERSRAADFSGRQHGRVCRSQRRQGSPVASLSRGFELKLAVVYEAAIRQGGHVMFSGGPGWTTWNVCAHESRAH